MRVLLTNSALSGRTGSELYLFDVAKELFRRGHQPVCFSPTLGDLAQEFTAMGIPVVDNLARIGAPPDVIHGQHHMETLAALLHFPGVPAIGFCHGWAPWQEAPLRFPRIYRYVTVSALAGEGLTSRYGIEPGRVELLGNFFDEHRFKRRAAVAQTPCKALAFGNHFDRESRPVREACRQARMELTVAGEGSGNPVARPEELLPSYDVVFATGRCAIEAMATGAAVVVCSPAGCGPMVDLTNFEFLRSNNFGMRTLTEPYTSEALRAAIACYDAGSVAAVTSRLRGEATLHQAVTRLIAIYEAACEWGKAQPSCPEEEELLAGEYLQHWSPSVRKWADTAGRLRTAEALLADTRQQLANRDLALDSCQAQLTAIQKSLAWRAASAVLALAPVRLAGRAWNQAAASLLHPRSGVSTDNF